MREKKAYIKSALLAERKKMVSPQLLLEEINCILAINETQRSEIRHTLQSDNNRKAHHLRPELLETDRIFHLIQIKAVCIDYRLRFLDSHFFKDGIPEEAVSQIARLQKTHDTILKGFKIMAPTKAFQLLSYDDPLLFAPIGNDYFYLIFQWGKDITPRRKWLMKPFKSLLNFVWFCLAVSLVLTCLTPENNLSRSVPMADIIIFLFAFKSIVAVFLYAFFMMGKNFNNMIWDREFFNN